MLIPSLSHPRLSMRALPRIDHRILIAIVVPVIIGGIALISLVIYIIIRLKKRPHEAFGPYEGTLVHPDDLAAQITPYCGSGPHRGRNTPRFIHTPGEDMRIAFRRPDGAWDISDSLKPFEPAGVNNIDVLTSHYATRNERLFNPPSKEWEVKNVGYEFGYGFSIDLPLPPPAYSGHSDGNHYSV